MNSEVIGRGFHGIVLRKSDAVVRKYFSSKQQWKDEISSLSYLAEESLSIGCTIPKLFASGLEETIVEGKSYSCWVDMSFVPGRTAHDLIASGESDVSKIGESLGSVLLKLHKAPSTENQISRLSADDNCGLLDHIFEDKVPTILRVENNPHRLSLVSEAMDYLTSRKDSIAAHSILGHQDLNLKNIIVNDEHVVEGIVDWSGFGKTHPSIALYQLSRTSLWPALEKQYEVLGGDLEKAYVYAASTIHAAWSTCYWSEVDEIPADENPVDNLKECYERFQTYR